MGGGVMKKNGDPDGPPAPPPIRVVAETRDRVRAEVLETVGTTVESQIGLARVWARVLPCPNQIDEHGRNGSPLSVRGRQVGWARRCSRAANRFLPRACMRGGSVWGMVHCRPTKRVRS